MRVEFFSVAVLGLTGMVRYMVFAGIATNPDGRWMQQPARNLQMMSNAP
jgi:hypothetical protein